MRRKMDFFKSQKHILNEVPLFDVVSVFKHSLQVSQNSHSGVFLKALNVNRNRSWQNENSVKYSTPLAFPKKIMPLVFILGSVLILSFIKNFRKNKHPTSPREFQESKIA